jgi:predicted XRE-type DNA-binding protein
MTGEMAVTRGSGNVFADLGFDNPEEEVLKAQLVREIRDLLKRRRLTQAKAAELLGLKRPDVSALVNARVHKFSLERHLRCIRRLDREVEIVTRPKDRRESSEPLRRHRHSSRDYAPALRSRARRSLSFEGDARSYEGAL